MYSVAQSVIFPQEQQAGTAVLTSADQASSVTYTIGNDLLQADYVKTDGTLLFEGCDALDGGGKLTMVASQDDATDTAHGNPAGCFQGLGCLVDKQGAKLLTI